MKSRNLLTAPKSVKYPETAWVNEAQMVCRIPGMKTSRLAMDVISSAEHWVKILQVPSSLPSKDTAVIIAIASYVASYCV